MFITCILPEKLFIPVEKAVFYEKKSFDQPSSATGKNKNMQLRPFLKITDEITLHLARPELAEPIFQVVDQQRDFLRRWLPWVDETTTLEDTKTFIRESMGHNTKGTRLIAFIMKGSELAGSIGVVQFIKDHRKCEIGYWLREDLQGQGVMSRVCSGFVNYLFKTKDLNRIEVLVAVGNQKSRAIPLRLGFEKEGILRQSLRMDGEYFDVEMFALLKKDWQVRHMQENFNQNI